MLSTPPILAQKQYEAPSVFTARNLLREARRQKALPEATVPAICVVNRTGILPAFCWRPVRLKLYPHWACYHTTLYTFDLDGRRLGIIGCAVGAAFAVLIAEELFASGCTLLISITSSGQITALGEPPYFILIDRALRDEGTSYHYLPPSDFSTLAPSLRQRVETRLQTASLTLYTGRDLDD